MTFNFGSAGKKLFMQHYPCCHASSKNVDLIRELFLTYNMRIRLHYKFHDLEH